MNSPCKRRVRRPYTVSTAQIWVTILPVIPAAQFLPCGFDARLAGGFLTYGECRHVSAAEPVLTSGDGRWLLLTSYSHPMNPSYRRSGIAADLKVLSMAAEAADRLGVDRGDVIWHPHPAIGQIGRVEREKLVETARQCGFSVWPEGLAYGAMADFGQVLTTPSTAAVDALRLGKLPVIVAPEPVQADIVYGSFGSIAGDADDLVKLVSASGGRNAESIAFEKAWQKIEPGGKFVQGGGERCDIGRCVEN